ncbi:hypothetical protein SSX86_004390 [Deinandra increscens subsp. villosa]|uniref:Cyclin C-terminal domain-containing protein n=1 Tax=Deinandra increscens subsp. villosa TaxID=3103831 RepID=A0AAP0DNH5_9ASTR
MTTATTPASALEGIIESENYAAVVTTPASATASSPLLTTAIVTAATTTPKILRTPIQTQNPLLSCSVRGDDSQIHSIVDFNFPCSVPRENDQGAALHSSTTSLNWAMDDNTESPNPAVKDTVQEVSPSLPMEDVSHDHVFEEDLSPEPPLIPLPAEVLRLDSLCSRLRVLGFPLTNYLQRLESESDLSAARSSTFQTFDKGLEEGVFQPETLITAVTYLDMFMSKPKYSQMIDSDFSTTWALACFSLATKMVEVEAKQPTMPELSTTFNVEETSILHCETVISEALDWNFAVPTPFTFLEYFKEKMSLFLIHDPKDILILALQEKKFIQFLPSELAAALVLIYSSDPLLFTNELFHDSSEETIMRCAKMLFELIKTHRMHFKYQTVVNLVHFITKKMNVSLSKDTDSRVILKGALEDKGFREYLPNEVAAAVVLTFSTDPQLMVRDLISFASDDEDILWKCAEWIKSYL